CPYKLVCPAFWTKADENWAGRLDGETALGPLNSPPFPLHGKTAYALPLTAEAGTMRRGEAALTPLPATVHAGISDLSTNDRVRIVGLGRRENGTCYATLRTVILPEGAIPGIQLEDTLGERRD